MIPQYVATIADWLEKAIEYENREDAIYDANKLVHALDMDGFCIKDNGK